MVRFFVLIAWLSLGVTSAAGDARALEAERVSIVSSLASKGPFTAELVRPAGAGPFPVVVALHGCGGLFTPKGALRSRETDWAERLVAAGYVVLFPDSFTARGMREICSAKERLILPKDRAEDVAAAAEWLGKQAFVDKTRVALLGWSHGAMTVLWAVRPGFVAATPPIRTAVAFYPGCREIARLPDWRPSMPLTVLMGAEDDWTQPGPCRDLAQRTGFRYVEYPGAYHDFDAPAAPVRIRKGIGSLKRGEAHVGTDPEAREAAIKEVMAIMGAALRAP